MGIVITSIVLNEAPGERRKRIVLVSQPQGPEFNI